MRNVGLRKRYGMQHLMVWVIVGLMVGMVLAPESAVACAVCWGGDDPFSRGLNVSIMFLISMPFLVGGSVMGAIYIAHQRARGVRWPYIPTKTVTRMRKESKR